MKNNLEIEKMKISDIKTVRLLEQNQEISIISENSMINDISNNTTNYFVLKLNSVIIGYISFSYIFENMDLESIVIDKNYQNKGYASFLLNFLFNFALEHNIQNIFLEVRTSNAKAINLYTKNGFTRISTRKNYYTDTHEDAYIYTKKITY